MCFLWAIKSYNSKCIILSLYFYNILLKNFNDQQEEKRASILNSQPRIVFQCTIAKENSRNPFSTLSFVIVLAQQQLRKDELLALTIFLAPKTQKRYQFNWIMNIDVRQKVKRKLFLLQEGKKT